MSTISKVVLLSLVCVVFAYALVAEPIRLNHIQVIGTHNSYHVRPPDWILETLEGVRSDVYAWDYTHDPLDVQLDNGVRNFELDLHPFADGFEVLHVPVVDAETTCPTFMDCLRAVRKWSERYPNHIPISFLLEFKLPEAYLDGRPLMPLDASMLEMLEQEILTFFPRDKIITPDDVRGDAETLTDAARARGWPLLEDALGKVFFVLHNRRELRAAYTESHPALEQRIMFVNSSPERDDCAFIVVDNPYAERIPELIEAGFLIRVRSDSGLRQGRSGDTARRDAAFESGAHVVSTDFPAGRAHPETGYVVTFPDRAPARCNPVYSPDDCQAQLERVLRLKE